MRRDQGDWSAAPNTGLRISDAPPTIALTGLVAAGERKTGAPTQREMESERNQAYLNTLGPVERAAAIDWLEKEELKCERLHNEKMATISSSPSRPPPLASQQPRRGRPAPIRVDRGVGDTSSEDARAKKPAPYGDNSQAARNTTWRADAEATGVALDVINSWDPKKNIRLGAPGDPLPKKEYSDPKPDVLVRTVPHPDTLPPRNAEEAALRRARSAREGGVEEVRRTRSGKAPVVVGGVEETLRKLEGKAPRRSKSKRAPREEDVVDNLHEPPRRAVPKPPRNPVREGSRDGDIEYTLGYQDRTENEILGLVGVVAGPSNAASGKEPVWPTAEFGSRTFVEEPGSYGPSFAPAPARSDSPPRPVAEKQPEEASVGDPSPDGPSIAAPLRANTSPKSIVDGGFERLPYRETNPYGPAYAEPLRPDIPPVPIVDEESDKNEPIPCGAILRSTTAPTPKAELESNDAPFNTPPRSHTANPNPYGLNLDPQPRERYIHDPPTLQWSPTPPDDDRPPTPDRSSLWSQSTTQIAATDTTPPEKPPDGPAEWASRMGAGEMSNQIYDPTLPRESKPSLPLRSLLRECPRDMPNIPIRSPLSGNLGKKAPAPVPIITNEEIQEMALEGRFEGSVVPGCEVEKAYRRGLVEERERVERERLRAAEILEEKRKRDEARRARFGKWGWVGKWVAGVVLAKEEH